MRINCLKPDLLSDVHLRAEFREIIMSIHYYKRSSRTKNGIDYTKVSDIYTLNKGHGYMWYNKFGYIKNRYFILLEEMKTRGFRTDEIENKFLKIFNELIPQELIKDWIPTYQDKLINLERIIQKLHLKYSTNKLDFYKYKKQNKTFNEWIEFYKTEFIISDIENILKKLK